VHRGLAFFEKSGYLLSFTCCYLLVCSLAVYTQKNQKHFATIIVSMPICEPISSDPCGFDKHFLLYTCVLARQIVQKMYDASILFSSAALPGKVYFLT
jgi:hypothetical protein